MKYVVFLQNAWSPLYAGGTWPRERWMAALWTCRSGMRLKRTLLQNIDIDDVWMDNTTPIVGEDPCSIVPPNLEHVTEVIYRISPRVVVACGKQAGDVLALTIPDGISLLAVPHPAARSVTDAIFNRANKIIRSDAFIFGGKRMILKPARDYTWKEENLP